MRKSCGDRAGDPVAPRAVVAAPATSTALASNLAPVVAAHAAVAQAARAAAPVAKRAHCWPDSSGRSDGTGRSDGAGRSDVAPAVACSLMMSLILIQILIRSIRIF